MKSRRDFERAFKTGSRARSAILLVVVVENGLAHTRLGLSVGKSVWKRAVRRNRVRRIFREAFRTSAQRLPAGVDIVMVPGAKQLEPEFGLTCRDLVHLAHKAWRRQQEKLAARERTASAEAPIADAPAPQSPAAERGAR